MSKLLVQYFIYIELPREGTWKLLDELYDPELKNLASRLPDTIRHNPANSTVRKYIGAYKRWKLILLPAQPQHFVPYQQHLGNTVKSKSGMQYISLGALHVWLCFPTSSHPFVKTTLEGLQCELAIPTVKRSRLVWRYLMQW